MIGGTYIPYPTIFIFFHYLFYLFLFCFLTILSGLNKVLDLVPLDWLDWAKIGGAVVIHSIIVEVMKVILRWKSKRDAARYVI